MPFVTVIRLLHLAIKTSKIRKTLSVDHILSAIADKKTTTKTEGRLFFAEPFARFHQLFSNRAVTKVFLLTLNDLIKKDKKKLTSQKQKQFVLAVFLSL